MKKKLLLVTDSFLYKTPDGKYWAKTIYSYDFFCRYLNVFDEVLVISRTYNCDMEYVKNFLRSDGPKMSVIEIPPMRGMLAYLINIINILKTSIIACKQAKYALIRLPSVSAFFVSFFVASKGIPYALEIVADPYGAYSSNFIAKHIFTIHMKYFCQKANGVSYVTKEYLQKLYPSKIVNENNNRFESYYSTIDLKNDYFSCPRNFLDKEKFSLIHVANNMNNDIKGHEVLINAANILIKEGYDIDVVFVGDGLLRSKFQKLSLDLGIEDRIHFLGILSDSNSVRDVLLKSDIFVFPTKTEGLPRVIIEAMAVGLPCISTPVAGIPELLEKDDMLDPCDCEGFANRIKYLIEHKELLNQMSIKNIKNAQEYLYEKLQKRRDDFYRKLFNTVR